MPPLFPALLLWTFLAADAPTELRVHETPAEIQIETAALRATVRKTGYVSGIAAGTFVDKKTGAHDQGFGLHIMDFLLAPGWRDDGYPRDKKVHGDLPKHYVEGPQICTKARSVRSQVVRGKDFVAVRLTHRFTEAAPGLKPGSTWEQTLLFQPRARYVLSAEKITSANDVPDLFYRIDMPGHIRHRHGDTFSRVYLSYHGEIPASAFADNFAPDDRYLYRRGKDPLPERFIRAYQIRQDDKDGPWLAGMTLDPGEVYQAWCHERDYVCMIEELHGRPVRAGESFGAAYVVGFFDDVPEMEHVYDRYRGARTIIVTPDGFRLK